MTITVSAVAFRPALQLLLMLFLSVLSSPYAPEVVGFVVSFSFSTPTVPRAAAGTLGDGPTTAASAVTRWTAATAVAVASRRRNHGVLLGGSGRRGRRFHATAENNPGGDDHDRDGGDAAVAAVRMDRTAREDSNDNNNDNNNSGRGGDNGDNDDRSVSVLPGSDRVERGEASEDDGEEETALPSVERVVATFLELKERAYGIVRRAFADLVEIIRRSATKARDWASEDDDDSGVRRLLLESLGLIGFFAGVAAFAAWNIQILSGGKSRWSGPAGGVTVPVVRVPAATPGGASPPTTATTTVKFQKPVWKAPRIRTSYATTTTTTTTIDEEGITDRADDVDSTSRNRNEQGERAKGGFGNR